ncbi:ABC transporter permease [Asticcacaulis sp. YBE204]|uniref:ABC transporter permease n=1 Tax=Asticcacaulis sp. YBE204 TaxID=1282363 RepID=UPI0003C3DCC3|nr:ABC transporter permease [Asticcacaulis sp. YBE204]ESQ80743.1 hypothetical protein AEYBE204_00035 [Asticcacaulis sp. YBE204]
MATNNQFFKAINDLRAGIGLSHVWLYQAYHDISAKYKRTLLGSFWNTGSMIAMSGSMAIVFGALFNQDLSVVFPWIMSGMIAFSLVGHVFNEAPEVYVQNGGIISNHAYPFTYYSFEAVTRNLFLFAHNLVVFYIILALLRVLTLPHWTIVPGMLIVVFNMLTWGALVSMVSARYKDLRFLLPYLSQLVMFMSPIMYRPSMIPAHKMFIVDYNPFYPFIEMVRSPMLGTFMPAKYWGMALGITVAGVLLWLLFFSLNRRRIPFWI